MASDALPPLSKYRLIRPLGAGGMGTVYLAHDTALGRDVAIKFVRADRCDPKALKRLVREARVAAALDHPAICAVYDIVLEPEGQAFIVMQYVEGETLATRLQRGPLPLRDTVALTLQLTDALGEAHRRGIIHGDLKPQNIMLTPEGHPKLLDFGIATLTAAASAHGTGDATTSTTEPVFAGTPQYMSPEQVTRQPLDGRSDLFSLGCVFYECLTSRRAFDGQNTLDIYSRIVNSHPPPPSEIRPDLTAAHDETCRRLLAKEPDDRFQSAEQLEGALRVLLPDSTRSTKTAPPVYRTSRTKVGVGLALLAVLLLAMWAGFMRKRELPAAPQEAVRWYEQGTYAIREGSYHRAKLALNQALKIHREYPQAYTRLAEAHIELEEVDDAGTALLNADRLVSPDRLGDIDRTRNEALRALLLHERDKALAAYQRIAQRTPKDAGAWVDLGRIQESAGLLSDARKSFERALQIDPSFAAAHLRLGALETFEGRRSEALAAFDEAERLYGVAADAEGQTATLLLRGAFLDSLGELKEARAALERAHGLALVNSNRYQAIRAELRMSSVTATEGRVSESLKEAERAVRAAREIGIDTVAAEGLIELGATLTQARQFDAADAQLTEALAIARRENAEGLALRATLNLASLRQAEARPAEAIALAGGTLEQFAARRDRPKRLSALAIIARCHEDLEQYPQAEQIARQLLAAAAELQDQPHLALAYESLATQATVFGRLPEALEHRIKVEEIHRRLGHQSSLASDLVNRADLLIRLGRGPDAETLLQEIDKGAARGLDAYVARARRVIVLRALNAIIARQFADARRKAASVGGGDLSPRDSTGQLGNALLAFAVARSGGGPRTRAALAEPSAGLLAWRREVRYWQLASTLAAGGDPARVREDVRAALQSLRAAASDELEWRLAALGTIAAERLGDEPEAVTLREQAQAALQRLRITWREHAAAYERRSDLTELRTLARL